MTIEGEDVFLMDQLKESDIPRTSVDMIAEAIRSAKKTGECQFVWLSKAPEGKHGFHLKMSMGGATLHIDDPDVPPWA